MMRKLLLFSTIGTLLMIAFVVDKFNYKARGVQTLMRNINSYENNRTSETGTLIGDGNQMAENVPNEVVAEESAEDEKDESQLATTSTSSTTSTPTTSSVLLNASLSSTVVVLSADSIERLVYQNASKYMHSPIKNMTAFQQAVKLDRLLAKKYQLTNSKMSEIVHHTQLAPTPNKHKLPHILLAWTQFFKQSIPEKHYMADCAQLSRYCQITDNRDQLANASAVVFHWDDILWDDMPATRLSHQRYVIFSHESPEFEWRPKLDSMLNFFNWSMNYRLDADVPWPYSQAVLPLLSSDNSKLCQKGQERNRILREEIQTAIKAKTKPVVWVSSNCQTKSKREEYVQQLQQHIQVDVFGRCGTLNCSLTISEANDAAPDQLAACEQMFERSYYFMVAFENSVCRDYITEKFWGRLNRTVVLLVLKKSLYVYGQAPPNSYIAVDDFQSPKELAEYLQRLIDHPSEYLRYFQWRFDGYEVRAHNPPRQFAGFCGLCKKLLDHWPSKSYPNMTEWMVDDAHCDADYARLLVNRA